MKVALITEGSAEIGFGHISRCISLYQAFKEKGISPDFLINTDEKISNFMNNTHFLVLDWIKNEITLFKDIKDYDIAIIDSYLADLSIYKKIAQNVKVAAYIDDTMRLNYPPGVVINGSIHAKKLNYPNNPNIDYLLGPKYSMLKKEFWTIPTKIANIGLDKILITFGGSDIRNLTPNVIKLLNNEFSNIIKKIVIGKSFKNIAQIEVVSNEASKLIYFPSTKTMKEEMIDADIAITAGGQTVYELACVGVPAITVAVSKNQIHSVKICDELGLNYYAGWWEDKNLFDNIKKNIHNLKNKELRKKMIKRSQRIIKPDGSRKIIDFLIKKVEYSI